MAHTCSSVTLLEENALSETTLLTCLSMIVDVFQFGDRVSQSVNNYFFKSLLSYRPYARS